MVDADVVAHEILQVNQEVLFLHHKCRRQRQHEESIRDRNLCHQYFFQDDLRRMHLRLLEVVGDKHVLLRHEDK